MHGRCEFLIESPISRALHCVLEIVNLFVLAVFVAVITSQLTTATILAVPPTVKDLRGLRIGIQTNLLQPFLQSVQVAAIPVIYNTLEDAVKLIYTTNPDNLDGYLTTTEIVQYFNQKYGNGAFKQTETFLSSNDTPDQKAFAISKALPRPLESQFNAALETHRVAGDVALLYRKYIAEPQTTASDEALPLDYETRVGVTSAAAAASIALVLAIIAVHFWSRWRRGGPRGTRHPLRRYSGAQNGGSSAALPMAGMDDAVFRGRAYRVDPADAAECESFLAQCAERARDRALLCYTTAGLSYKESSSSPAALPAAPSAAVFSTSPLEQVAQDRLVGYS